MKKIVPIILFVIITLAITLVNATLGEDSANVDVKFQNVEAFGGTEISDREKCRQTGGMCIVYEDGHTLFLPGLSMP